MSVGEARRAEVVGGRPAAPPVGQRGGVGRRAADGRPVDGGGAGQRRVRRQAPLQDGRQQRRRLHGGRTGGQAVSERAVELWPRRRDDGIAAVVVGGLQQTKVVGERSSVKGRR